MFTKAAAATPFLLLLIALGAARPAGGQPQRVLMGMHVVDISELDLRRSTYTVDFYLWVRSRAPHEGTNFELMNGTGPPCVLGLRTEKAGVRYNVFRCRYDFHRVFDVGSYPLDEHELTVEVEDRALSEAEQVYVPDTAYTRVDASVQLPGWRIGAPRMRVTTHRYSAMSNPDNPPDSQFPFSRMVLAIPIRRAGASIYLKSFLVMYLSVIIGLLGSAISSEHVEARLGVGVASIFGVVSSYLVVAEALPETAQFTLADKLHMVAMGSVFASILVSVMAYRIYSRQGEERAERLDRWLGWGTSIVFAVAAGVVTVLR